MVEVVAVTDAVAIAAITSSASIFVSGISAYFAYKAKTVSEGTHKAVNSRLTELMRLSKKTYLAEGNLQGKAEEKANQALEGKSKGSKS